MMVKKCQNVKIHKVFNLVFLDERLSKERREIMILYKWFIALFLGYNQICKIKKDDGE